MYLRVHCIRIYVYIYNFSACLFKVCSKCALCSSPEPVVGHSSRRQPSGGTVETISNREANPKIHKYVRANKNKKCESKQKQKNMRANKNKYERKHRTNMKTSGGQLSEKEGHKSTNPQNVHLRKSTKYTFTVKVLLIHKMHVRESTKVHKV